MHGLHPVVDVAADHRELGHADRNVVEPVVPTGEEAGEGSPALEGVVAESTETGVCTDISPRARMIRKITTPPIRYDSTTEGPAMPIPVGEP